MEKLHKAVWEWLLPCKAIKNLTFNFLADDTGTVGLIPQNNFVDETIQEFNDGSSERRYSVTFVCLEHLTTEKNTTKNIDVVEQIGDIITWINEQNAAEAFPAFPEGYNINEIRATSDGQDVQTDSEKVVRYGFTIEILYFKGV